VHEGGLGRPHRVDDVGVVVHEEHDVSRGRQASQQAQLEIGRGGPVALRAQQQLAAGDVVVTEPGDGHLAQVLGSSGQVDQVEPAVPRGPGQLDAGRQRHVVGGGSEERRPVAPTLDEVTAVRDVGQDAVDVEHRDGGQPGRAVAIDRVVRSDRVAGRRTHLSSGHEVRR
jgi:hypothetical protein